MARSSRKQRELDERGEMILDIAKALIADHGFAALGMDQIAETANYSKGTIYQHFAGKEEVLIHLAMRGSAIWRAFFLRALEFQGKPRERLTALHYAHHFYAKLYPVEYQANYAVKVSGIREKISPESHTAHETLLKSNIDIVGVVVEEAIRLGDLVLPAQFSVPDLIYAFWATHYGNLALQAYGFAYERMGISNGEANTRQVFRFLLDGMNWRPLSEQHDYAATVERVLTEIFPQENRALRE